MAERWLTLGAEVLVAVAGIFLAGVLAYATGSFLLLRRYAPERSFGAFLRSIVREIVLAIVTQPFLPLFYLFGHRMEAFLLRRARVRVGVEASNTTVPVVFVHGYMHNRVAFVGLARELARRGIGPLYGFNYPWFTSIASNAARLRRFVERIQARTKVPAVDLVCHSMGGLVATEMLRQATPESARSIRKLVTIATPHAGVAWTGPILGLGASSLRRGSKLLETHAGYTLAVPALSIYSTHDNIVHPKETSSLARRGGRDVEVANLGHLSILFASEVAEKVASFLAEPSPPVHEVSEPAASLPAHDGAVDAEAPGSPRLLDEATAERPPRTP